MVGKRRVLTADDVRSLLREACDMHGSQSKWASAAGVSPQFVSDVLSGYRAPGESITKALGLVENPRTWSLDIVRKRA